MRTLLTLISIQRLLNERFDFTCRFRIEATNRVSGGISKTGTAADGGFVPDYLRYRSDPAGRMWPCAVSGFGDTAEGNYRRGD